METWRIIITIILMTFSLVDLSATYYYVNKYLKWQPEKPYKLIENNPLLVFLWKTFGFHLGMFIGSTIILSSIYIISTRAHPIVVLLLTMLLTFALFNHYQNINLLNKLIEKYPTGHLPESTFGVVEGNNLK